MKTQQKISYYQQNTSIIIPHLCKSAVLTESSSKTAWITVVTLNKTNIEIVHQN